MTTRAQIALGLIGYGEVGSSLGLGLRREGLERVCAYDKFAFDGPFSNLVQRRAGEGGVTLVDSPEALSECSELILVVTPGSESVSVAEALSSVVRETHTCVDLAAATPRVKERVGAILSPTGALVGDGAIMSSPLEDGHQIRILASGPAAAHFKDSMAPWGMNISVVGQKLGAATGIKTLRTVLMKGLEALLVECALGSARYGILDEVLGSVSQWMDQRPFATTASFLLVTDAVHAKRRASEADMSVEALQEADVDPVMTRATAERLHWVAALGLKEHFGGVVPEHHRQVIEAIEQQLSRPAQGPGGLEDSSRSADYGAP